MTIEIEQLESLITSGEIDTVLTAFPDLQGRLMGKRVTGHYFLDHVAGEGATGIHACNYLLAVDVDMTPLPGYAFANWDEGYGDVRAVPDPATVRLIPWLEKTALVICDLLDAASAEPIAVSPRQILKRQVERAASAGYTVKFGSEIEFFLFRDSYEEAAEAAYSNLTPAANFNEDYAIFQTSHDEGLIRQIRNGMDAAGVPVEFSKGEAAAGQHEINLYFADALEMADRHAIYKNGAKEIAALNGHAITFMAKWNIDEVGSSCHIHSSIWDAEGDRPLTAADGKPDQLSPEYGQFVAGQLATGREFALLYAPYVNSYKRYKAESWAPTALVLGRDNRTCGFRIVGRNESLRVESRIPGADVNPYIAFAATIAAGLYGIESDLAQPEIFSGNAYAAEEAERVPSTLVEAIELFESSATAVAAFGPDVHAHLLNTARQEWAAFNDSVTDWELRRNFERI